MGAWGAMELEQERQLAITAGVVRREQILDNIFTEGELISGGWKFRPETGNWTKESK